MLLKIQSSPVGNVVHWISVTFELLIKNDIILMMCFREETSRNSYGSDICGNHQAKDRIANKTYKHGFGEQCHVYIKTFYISARSLFYQII